MATYTENFNLKKLDLKDSPPRITDLNDNWDTIDEELGNIGETVEEALGNLTPEKIGASPSDHTHTAEQVGALPLTGGLLSGDVAVNRGFGHYVKVGSHQNNGATFQIASDDNSKYSFLALRTDGTITLTRNGYGETVGTFKLFGEHNITKGTTDITSGSALATGCIHLVHE